MKIKYLKYIKKQKNGMSALLVVVIIGASSIIMAKSAAFLSLGELDMGQVVNGGNNALYLAEACLEEALFQIKFDNSFTVLDEELDIGSDSCVVSVSIDGGERNILVTGISGDYRKSLEANVSVLPSGIDFNSYSFKN